MNKKRMLTLLSNKNKNFTELMKSYFDIAYWKMNELSGDSLDYSGNNLPLVHTNITMNNLATGIGTEKMPFYSGSGYSNPYSDGFVSRFNFNQGSFVCLFKHAFELFEDIQYLFNVRGAGNYYPRIVINPNSSMLTAYRLSTAGIGFNCSGRTGVNLIGFTWDVANNISCTYSNGYISDSTTSGNTETTDTPTNTYTKIACSSTGTATRYIGNIGQIGFSSKVLTAAQMMKLGKALFSSTHGLFVLGDSKSENQSWIGRLCTLLETATGGVWIDKPRRYAFGGFDVGTGDFGMKTYIDNNLSNEVERPELIIINLGTNDARAVTITDETEFKTDYCYIIDKLRAKWAGVPIYCQHVYRADSAQTITNSGLINTYIDYCISQYESGVTVGVLDDVLIENGDAGVTYLSGDLVHYNEAAQSVLAQAWYTALGYT